MRRTLTFAIPEGSFAIEGAPADHNEQDPAEEIFRLLRGSLYSTDWVDLCHLFKQKQNLPSP